MTVHSDKEAWSHHFRPGRSLGTSTDKGKKTGGFEDERRNDRDPASAPQGALAGEATIHRRKRPHGTDRRAGFGDRTTSSEDRVEANRGQRARQWGKGKERRRGRRGKGTGRGGRETPAERPFQGPLGWKVTRRRWRQPERSGTRAESTGAQQEREGQGERQGDARRGRR